MGPEIKKFPLAVSAYDRAASWVIALNILIGSAVALMFLIWLGQKINLKGEQSDVVLVENIAGRGDHAAGIARDLEAPGADELQEETEPVVEQLLEAMTEVVSEQAASLDSLQTSMVSSKTGSGLGDSRPPGPLGEGDNIIPRGERWRISYNSNSLEAYARQLDHFGIELGVIGGGEQQVDYARNLSKSQPDTRSGPGGESDDRLYMLWTSGTLKRFDEQLLRAAGLATAGRIVVQFYPRSVENQLARIELEYAEENGKSSVKQIKKTVFGVRPDGGGFEYFVQSQRYRPVST